MRDTRSERILITTTVYRLVTSGMVFSTLPVGEDPGSFVRPGPSLRL